ncbi:unnamed protein product, partial [marine sediment metagenome]
ERQALAGAKNAADDKEFALLDRLANEQKDIRREKRDVLNDLTNIAFKQEELVMDLLQILPRHRSGPL